MMTTVLSWVPRVVCSEDRDASLRSLREAIRGDCPEAGPLGDERVRIATGLLRFSRSVSDPRVMVDAALAAVSQIVAEHGLDQVEVQGDFATFLAAAGKDASDQPRGSPHGQAKALLDPAAPANDE